MNELTNIYGTIEITTCYNGFSFRWIGGDTIRVTPEFLEYASKDLAEHDVPLHVGGYIKMGPFLLQVLEIDERGLVTCKKVSGSVKPTP